MKVIDKSNREMLLEFLELPNDIREYDINKQYTILHEKIEVLEKSIFLDDSIIEHKDYIPSKRQDATWQNALRNFQTKDYLNAYYEIFDYIDDYGNRENRNFFESEMNNIKSLLRGINKKIKEMIDFDDKKDNTNIDNSKQKEYINKIANLLELPTEQVAQYSLRIEDLHATYYYKPIRGGGSVLVSDDGLYLMASSSAISREELIKEYKAGKRDGNFKEKTDNINTNIYKDDINVKYKGISGIISIKNIIGSLPEKNNETKSSTNNEINIILPKEYQLMKSMPDDPENSVVYGKQTSNATCMAMLYYIDRNDAMPYNNEEIINGIHNSLKDDQGLIEVNNGTTKNNKKYVYSIVKTRKEPSGIQYTLTFQIETNRGILNIQSFFDEAGITGQRESIVMMKLMNEGKMNPDKMTGWMKDPYDETYNKGLMMNLAEQEEYDAVFPEHPLSEARNFVKMVIENN